MSSKFMRRILRDLDRASVARANSLVDGEDGDEGQYARNTDSVDYSYSRGKLHIRKFHYFQPPLEYRISRIYFLKRH
ncbi:MAG TPA: hypothetical protein ENH55_18440 [Aurantimonas coralicida]|nr:hypothetical protein [Aurantimonas coralicida]